MAVDTEGAKRTGCFAVIALGVFIALAAVVNFVIRPMLNDDLITATSADAQYKLVVKVMNDSFSGYAPMRSEDVRADLKTEGIKLDFTDDGADSAKRIAALKSGEADLAVFTIDTFLRAGADFGEYPGTIVMGIDESVGADGCVGHFGPDGKPPATLDTPATRFYGVGLSPSEFLARVVRSELSFNSLTDGWFVDAKSPADVYNDFRIDTDPYHLYCAWQPGLSQLLAEPDSYLVYDTSRVSEYVVDVLVARREFVRDHPEAIESVSKAVQRANYRFAHDQPALIAMLVADAKAMGAEKLTEARAADVAKTLRWTNVRENYARFGLLSPAETKGLSNWTDIIAKVMRVLVDTGAIEKDPLDGNYSTLFYGATFVKLQAEGFNPNAAQAGVPGLNDADLDAIRGFEDLPPLSDEEWNKMVTVGDVRVEAISFGNDKSTLGPQAQRDLDVLVTRMRSLRGNYVNVIGHAKEGGDPEKSLELATKRAQAAKDYLTSHGISEHRVRAIGMKPSGSHAASQTVTFALMQQNY